MADTFLHMENPSPVPDRRLHPRRAIRFLAYVSIGEDNGGIVLNISEFGLALQAVGPLTEGHLAHLRFQLPRSRKRGESSGQIAWTSESGKEAGVQFVGLSDDVRKKISAWVSSDSPWEPTAEELAAESEVLAPQPDAPPVETPAALTETVASVAAGDEAAAEKPPSDSIPAPEDAAVPISPAAPLEGKVAAIVTPSPITVAPVAPRMWPVSIEPPVKSEEQVQHARLELGMDRWRWGSVAAVISFLAILSFAAGLATGRGVFSNKPATFGSQPGSTILAASPTASAQATVTLDRPASSKSSARRENPGTLAAQTQDAGIAPQNLALRRSPNPSMNSAIEGETPPLSIELPESPVSASGSVAIRSRRSIPVPPESKPLGSAHVESLQIGRSISRRQPEYPADALEQQVEGTVKLHAIIGQDGAIQSVGEVTGPPLLVSAAMTAVREWRYEPTIYAGQPIETEEDITIVFRLPH
jgi:TonB family protein